MKPKLMLLLLLICFAVPSWSQEPAPVAPAPVAPAPVAPAPVAPAPLIPPATPAEDRGLTIPVQALPLEENGRRSRVMDKKFWFASAAIVGVTVLDVESTHRCVQRPGCREGNPIFGSNPTRTRMYSIKLPMAAFTMWATRWWKKSDMQARERYEHARAAGHRGMEKPSNSWWLPTAIYGGITGGAAIRNLAITPPRNATSSTP